MDIRLWSISDYRLFSNANGTRALYEIIINNISHDPYHTFISKIDDISKDYLNQLGLLSPVPLAIKDNIVTKDFPTTCGSRMLSGWVSPYDSTVVSHLKSEGAIIIGKTNLDEFAMGNTTETSYFGKTYNPWDPELRFSPGGSSGGSSVAVATGMVPVSLASDTGGSIRCPAAWTGVLGLKPTYGRVSRHGLIAYAHSLDQIGIFSRYAEDLDLMLKIISRPDKQDQDLTYKQRPYTNKSLKLDEDIIIGIIPSIIESLQDQQNKLINDALKIIESFPHVILTEIELPELDIMLPTYYITAVSEAFSNLARFTGEQYGFNAGDVYKTRLEGFGEEVRRRISLGSYSLQKGTEQELYKKAQKIRDYIRYEFKKIYGQVSVIALPTMQDFAKSWGEFSSPLESYKADLLTVPANLTGLPALSLPIGFGIKSGVRLPYGLQLLADWWREDLLIKLAWEYQQKTDHHKILPPPYTSKTEVSVS